MMLHILTVLFLFIKIAVFLEMYSNIDLEIQNVDKSHITFICSCNSPPYGETVEISINSVSVASITFLQNKCYILRRTCNSGECACTSTQFNMTLMIPVTKLYSLTCQVRELQEQHGRLLKLFKTITLNGTDIVNETIDIEQIRISNSGSTNSNTTITSGSKENTNINIVIGTLVPVVVVFIISFICLWKYFKNYLTRSQKRTEIRKTSNTETYELASTNHEDLSNDVYFKDLVHKDTSNESLLSFNTYASFKGSKPSNAAHSMIDADEMESYGSNIDIGWKPSNAAESKEDADEMESYGSNSEEEYMTGNEDAENDSLLPDDDKWNNQIDSDQKESCNAGTNGSAVILDANTFGTSTGLFATTTTSKPLNPIMAATTEPATDIIYQRVASDQHQ